MERGAVTVRAKSFRALRGLMEHPDAERDVERDAGVDETEREHVD